LELSSASVQEKLKTGPIIIQNQAAPPISFKFNRDLFYDMLGHGNMAHALQIEGELFKKMRHFIFETFYFQINLTRGKTGLFRG
jgi:hypothetical protein